MPCDCSPEWVRRWRMRRKYVVQLLLCVLLARSAWYSIKTLDIFQIIRKHLEYQKDPVAQDWMGKIAQVSWLLDEQGGFHASQKLPMPTAMKERVDSQETCESCDCSFLSEKGNPVNCDADAVSRSLVFWYIPQDASMLDVGVGDGSRACSIAYKQRQSGKLVSMYADRNLRDVLELNKKSHRCNFHAVHGVLAKTDGDITRGISGTTVAFDGEAGAKSTKDLMVPNFKLDELQSEYNMSFDHAIFDCEGCSIYAMRDFPDLFMQLKLVIIKAHDEQEERAVKKLLNDEWNMLLRRGKFTVLRSLKHKVEVDFLKSDPVVQDWLNRISLVAWQLDEFGGFHASPKLALTKGMRMRLQDTIVQERLYWLDPCASCDCSFLNEKGNPSNCAIEISSRAMVNRYIPEHSITLEVGARYGSNACAIAYKQRQSGKLVSVDADSRVWEILEMNRRSHRCHFHTVHGMLAKTDGKITYDGFGTKATPDGHSGETVNNASENVVVPHVTLEEIQSKYNMAFDHAIFDCEGCLSYVMRDFPELFEHLKLVIIEVHNDGEKRAVDKLLQAGWEMLFSGGDRQNVLRNARHLGQGRHKG